MSPSVRKKFKLTVNFEPQIEIKDQVVGATVGTNIVLRCDIQASPKPMTFWSKKSGMSHRSLYLQWITDCVINAHIRKSMFFGWQDICWPNKAIFLSKYNGISLLFGAMLH